MKNIKEYMKFIKPDKITGKLPTRKQLEVMVLINPFRAKSVKYSDVAKMLGITELVVKERMRTLSKRCPQIWQAFRRERFKDRVNHLPEKHSTGCVGCGCSVPEGQEMCYRCWREVDRKYNPDLYKKDPMFPTNGKTLSKIDLDRIRTAKEERW